MRDLALQPRHERILDRISRKLFASAGPGPQHKGRIAAALRNAKYGRLNLRFRFRVDAGDRHRDARRWAAGFKAYRSGLDIIPWHAGYLVQAGHCLKELGHFQAAECYYRSGLILGAPLSDIEHLQYVMARTGHSEPPERTRRIVEEAHAGAERINELATFDDLCATVASLGIADRVNLPSLVVLMRDQCTLDEARERLVAQFGLGDAALVQDGHSQKRELHRMAFDVLAPASTSAIVEGRERGPSTPVSQPRIVEPDRSPEQTLVDITSLARSFETAKHDTSTPMFFGSVPRHRDGNNVSNDAAAHPLVSIIILNHNRSHLTWLSVGSVLGAEISVPYEIIVVDNGSNPVERAVIDQISRSARLISLSVNRGFGEGNNIASESARGDYLLFLNSDAFLAPGAVDTLLSAFDAVPDCAVVGPVIRYPDGRLQEAGAFLLSDANTMRRGWGEAELARDTLPRFDIVDYVSAACALVKRSEFQAVGGFHFAFEPAYYEDVDLCLKLRLRLRTTILARDATCFHIENATTAQPLREGRLRAGASKRAFETMWGDYIHTRNSKDLLRDLPPESVEATEIGDGGAVALTEGPMLARPAERYMFALTAALGDGRPVTVASPAPWSRLRLTGLVHQLALDVRTRGSIPASEIARSRWRDVVVMGETAFPDAGIDPEVTTFVCHRPKLDGEQGRAGMREAVERLRRMKRVIVPSAAAKLALQAVYDGLGPLDEKIEILPAGAPILGIPPPPMRCPWIVSVGTFGDRGPDGRHITLIKALAAAPEAYRREWKLHLCGTIVDPVEADNTFRELMRLAGEAGVHIDIFATPPRARLVDLFARGAAFIQTTGIDVEDPRDYWRCDLFGTDLITALAAGCRTYAWHHGAAREIFAEVGAGQCFASFDELVALIGSLDCTPVQGPSADEVARERSDAAFVRRAPRARGGPLD